MCLIGNSLKWIACMHNSIVHKWKKVLFEVFSCWREDKVSANFSKATQKLAIKVDPYFLPLLFLLEHKIIQVCLFCENDTKRLMFFRRSTIKIQNVNLTNRMPIIMVLIFKTIKPVFVIRVAIATPIIHIFFQFEYKFIDSFSANISYLHRRFGMKQWNASVNIGQINQFSLSCH